MPKNYAEKFSPLVADRFKQRSYTAKMASQAYNWDGVKTIHVYSVDTAPLYDYNRNAADGTSRFGALTDLTDHLQTMTVGSDKAFRYAIDAGDNAEQLNVKGANRSLTRQMDEKVYPFLDRFNFAKWVNGAGQAVVLNAALSANNALEAMEDASEMLDEESCPDNGRVIYITTEFKKMLKKNPLFIYTDKLANEALVKGNFGELDGMQIVEVPKKDFPTGVHALIFYKEACLAPMKLQHYGIHSDTDQVDGDIVTGRILHDAFVLDAKAKAVVPICASTVTRTAAPTVANNGAITYAAGTKLYYTTDGSDPRCSGTRVEANANVAAPNAGTLVTAIAYNASNTVAWSAYSVKQA